MTTQKPEERLAGVSRVASEFRDLDMRRRASGLKGAEVERYHQLFAELSDVLAIGAAKRRMNARQFLRVPIDMELVIRAGAGERRAMCCDFGGGGCAITYAENLHAGDVVALAGVILAGERSSFDVRARVVWVRDGKVGLQFDFRPEGARDAIDRAFFRVLGAFLGEPQRRPSSAGRASAEARSTPT